MNRVFKLFAICATCVASAAFAEDQEESTEVKPAIAVHSQDDTEEVNTQPSSGQ